MRISDGSSDVCSSDLNLRRMKNNIEAFEDGDLHPDDVKKIATDLGVSEEDVVSMNRRMAMGGDTSLNVPMREDGEGQWQDWLADTDPLQDERVANRQDRKSTRLNSSH